MISVIIPSYNRSKTIRKSAASVLKQTYSDIELIIVDDCSDDDTAAVVESLHDDRVRYIRHEVNRGACAARNTGIDAAKGERIAFQDSDDEWRPEKLEKQLHALKKYDAEICFCKMERHGFPKDKAVLYPDLPAGVVSYESVILRSLASTQTIIADRAICLEHRFDPAIKRMQDYDWMIRAAKDHKVVFEDSVLVDTYLQEDSITSFDIEKIKAANEAFLQKYEYLFDEYPSLRLKLLNNIGRYRAQAGDRSGDEFQQIYELTGNRKTLLKNTLYKSGILKVYYDLKLGKPSTNGGGIERENKLVAAGCTTDIVMCHYLKKEVMAA